MSSAEYSAETPVESFGGGFFDRVAAGVSTSHKDVYRAAEMQECRAQLRITLQRIADVESINVDLESRLEAQAKEYIQLESDAAKSLAHWKMQYKALAEEAGSWKKLHAQQELKNQKIREQLLRTERELHGILQKKYDIMEYARREERFRMRAESSVGTSHGARPVTVSRNNEVDKPDRISWMRVETGFSTGNPLGALPQDVRRGRAILALADLFRLYMGDDDNTNHSQMVLHA